MLKHSISGLCYGVNKLTDCFFILMDWLVLSVYLVCLFMCVIQKNKMSIQIGWDVIYFQCFKRSMYNNFLTEGFGLMVALKCF